MKGKIPNLLILVAIMAVVLVAWSSTMIVEQLPTATSANPKDTAKTPLTDAINNPRPTATITTPEDAPPMGLIKSISFDKERYYAGDAITAMLEVENVGDADITSEKVTINATCVRLDDFTGNLYLKTLDEEERTESYTMHFSEIIGSGQTKILSANFNTLAEIEYNGVEVSLAGDYEILVTLDIEGETIDAKELELTLLGEDLEA
ncbi:MAG: hypothetical protein GKB99_00600 [Methanocellales archaeon]|nr:hypothetical protein [Methanocellales archaeon]